MSLRPWEHVPNIRAYYGALWHQIISDTFSYFWGQVVSGAVLALIAALVARNYGWIPRSDIWWTIGVSLIPYGIIVVVSLVVNAVRAPVKLDNERMRAISAVGTAKQSIEAQLETAHQELAAPKVSEIERHRRERVAHLLSKLSEDEKEVLKYLLLHGKTEPGNLLARGLSQEAMSGVSSKVKPDLLVVVYATRPGYPHYWDINPELRDALKFHLFGE